MILDNATLNIFFNIVNIIPLPVWILMVVAPKWNITHIIVRSHITSIVLSIIFIILNIVHFTNEADEFEISGFFSLNVIAYVFSKKSIVLIGWVHYLAFDLLIASWIFLDNLNSKSSIPHILMILCFILTYTFGPSGFLLYVTLKKLKTIKYELADKNKNE